MNRGESFWERLAERTDLWEEAMPGQTIVEIAGTGRVLIENHGGVLGYDCSNITVKVRFGCIQVSGCGLQIRRMSREQLIICGRIDSVMLHRRE